MAKKAKQSKEIVLESRVQTAKLREDILEVALEGDTTVIKSPRAIMGIEVELVDHTRPNNLAPASAVYELLFYYTRTENDRIVRYRLPGAIYVTNNSVIISGAEQTGKYKESEISYKEQLG